MSDEIKSAQKGLSCKPVMGIIPGYNPETCEFDPEVLDFLRQAEERFDRAENAMKDFARSITKLSKALSDSAPLFHDLNIYPDDDEYGDE